ncbi:MAG: GntR family transcriptional regulator [Acidimicrobiia bacterium]|nr:GntR family transcriptional regulator [Acidimicrobiia bacterium]
MPTPSLPKYQAIHAALRGRILSGELAPGERLPPQQELADSFGVTLMTLRQAVAALESDGLVRAERGNGTFVADRPVDIRVGNLSSFAQQMRSAGVEMTTEILERRVCDVTEHPSIASALGGVEGDELLCVRRRRSVRGIALSLQRSYLLAGVISLEPDGLLVDDSLYDTIEAATGWVVSEAKESITAVSVSSEDANTLGIAVGDPALLSIRTSINQFGQPFLYDEALLVSGRCVLTADRTAGRMSLNFGVALD